MGTFSGLEMAKRALYTQQSALHTTGHNISNANTEGYSRQRVNFESTTPYPSGSRNRPHIPGQIGTGVEAGAVERIRDKFLDSQFRTENSKSGYWETMSDSIGRMENILNEPSENGLADTMDKFWEALQDLSVNPENSGARSVVVQRGVAVAETFNYLSNSLGTVQEDLDSRIGVTVEDTNSILRQIDGINNQIKELEPHGYLANDLYDERDRLIDELSNIVNIKVKYEKSGDGAQDIADGLVSIQLVNDNGQPYENPIHLLEANGEPRVHELSFTNGTGLSVEENDEGTTVVNEITIGEDSIKLPVSHNNGSLHGLLDAHGYSDDSAFNFQSVLEDLDAMAKVFAEEFNKVHQDGTDLEGNTGIEFFTGNDSEGFAASIGVSEDIKNNPDLIAASESGNSGDGSNAVKLSEVFRNRDIDGLGENTSVKTFYESLIGKLGVRAQEANRMSNNTTILRSQVEDQRMSVSSVSLDEEMTNMIKFQHAYNAAARSMTAMDEMIDRIINNMGLVGR
ncbi:flagellar hook-associated protein FlgK [Ornithinibacillus halophilus]|uniref:Flagellar hook-associated protein 1 n=1 Tax=Ornithinibacillus halophilus TaxID=930117 RepID=A0A1M5FCU8_9BACI|nr:flagellar hook-associated protein FlgK [Ornithinibacillus halophilus]SHF89258.1 flagellar hook-associated protein 1 FlgK [Ornithinibacillus halophilus]